MVSLLSSAMIYNTKDGTNVRDYVQVEDLIDAHILALKHMMKTNKSDVFNLGTAQGYSNLEILESAKKLLVLIFRTQWVLAAAVILIHQLPTQLRQELFQAGSQNMKTLMK